MGAPADLVQAPLDAAALAARWGALLVDPAYEDLPAKLELTEWGEMLISPVGRVHGVLAMRIGRLLVDALDGEAMAEVGVITQLGVRVPDVAWASAEFLAMHPEEAALTAAPEICIEIASPSNALPKLREKAHAYVVAGAREAWIVFPGSREIEVRTASGRGGESALVPGAARIFG